MHFCIRESELDGDPHILVFRTYIIHGSGCDVDEKLTCKIRYILPNIRDLGMVFFL